MTPSKVAVHDTDGIMYHAASKVCAHGAKTSIIVQFTA